MSKYFLTEGNGKPETDLNPDRKACVGEFETLKEISSWLEDHATPAEQDEFWDWLENLVDMERDMQTRYEYAEISRRRMKMRRKKK